MTLLLYTAYSAKTHQARIFTLKKVVTLLSVPVVLLVAWGATSWYIGQQTESTLKQYIAAQNEQTAASGVRQEMVSYTKSAFGATAVTKLVMDVPPFNELGDIQFTNTISNGPVFFGGVSPIAFGTARIHTQLDTSAFAEDTRQWLNTAFAGKTPLAGNTVIGFNGDSTYDFTLNPLKVDKDGVLAEVEPVHLTGTAKPDMTGTMQLTAGKISIKEEASQFTLPSLQMNGTITGMVAGQALGTFDVKAPGVEIQAAGTTVPTRFDLALQTTSDVQDNLANGKLAMQASNIQGVDDALSKLDVQMDFAGLAVEGLQELQKLQADLQSAQSRIDWNPEALETPEGQKQQEELLNKINETGSKMVEAIFAKTLKTDKSRLQTKVVAESPKGKLNGSLDLTYTGTATPDLMTLASYTPNDWGKMLKGKVSLDADKALLPPGTEMMLAPMEQQGFLKVEGDKITSNLELAGETAILNGKSMPFADLMQLLAPEGAGMGAAGSDTGADMGIPPDLMQKIEKEGITPEVLQLLEESDDVPKETVEMLKQLQQLQTQMQQEGAAGTADKAADNAKDEAEPAATEKK